jgi:hypothetical protein
VTSPQPDYALGGVIPGGRALELIHAGDCFISRAQLDALGEAAVRRVLDRLNRSEDEGEQ